MSTTPDEPTTPTEEPQNPPTAAGFTAPTAEMKRKNRITGLAFFAIAILFLSISTWRRFFS